ETVTPLKFSGERREPVSTSLPSRRESGGNGAFSTENAHTTHSQCPQTLTVRALHPDITHIKCKGSSGVRNLGQGSTHFLKLLPSDIVFAKILTVEFGELDSARHKQSLKDER
ncbi:MAG: hypothetical protein ACRCZO_17420, partial [Cetobacterium sp.]